MGAAGSGASGQLWRLLRQDGVRLVSTDTLFVRYTGSEALADLPERKLYLKTRHVRYEPRLTGLFDKSRLENAVTEQHSNEHCDGGEDCPVTRGLGACYVASGASRAMLDPYWLGGTRRHVKRSPLRAVAIFRREPVGAPIEELQPRDAIALLEHASATGLAGSPTTVPWYNENLLDRSSERLDAQRRLFERLFRAARPFALNTAYGASPEQLTEKLLALLR
jgi:hypothetical protein